MANRTVLVDNNTWNNTHISRVGQVGCNLGLRILKIWEDFFVIGFVKVCLL